jgi:hypothetical protein
MKIAVKMMAFICARWTMEVAQTHAIDGRRTQLGTAGLGDFSEGITLAVPRASSIFNHAFATIKDCVSVDALR